MSEKLHLLRLRNICCNSSSKCQQKDSFVKMYISFILLLITTNIALAEGDPDTIICDDKNNTSVKIYSNKENKHLVIYNRSLRYRDCDRRTTNYGTIVSCRGGLLTPNLKLIVNDNCSAILLTNKILKQRRSLTCYNILYGEWGYHPYDESP